MKQKKCHPTLFFVFIVVLLFVLAPLALLIVRGGAKVSFALHDKNIRYALLFTLKTALISTLLCLLLALPTAYTIVRKKNMVTHICSLFLGLPIALPHLIAGVALLLFWGNQGIGSFLRAKGIYVVFTKISVVIAQLYVCLPFMIRELVTALEEQGDRLEFTARTLGSTSFQAFFYITVPSIRRSIGASVVAAWSRAIGEFGAVIMMAGVVSGKTEVLAISVFMHMSTGNLDLAIGVATILILLSVITNILVDVICNREVK